MHQCMVNKGGPWRETACCTPSRPPALPPTPPNTPGSPPGPRNAAGPHEGWGPPLGSRQPSALSRPCPRTCPRPTESSWVTGTAVFHGTLRALGGAQSQAGRRGCAATWPGQGRVGQAGNGGKQSPRRAPHWAALPIHCTPAGLSGPPRPRSKPIPCGRPLLAPVLCPEGHCGPSSEARSCARPPTRSTNTGQLPTLLTWTSGTHLCGVLGVK